MADSETEICKDYGTVVVGQETNMVVDYGMKAKTLELRVRCKIDGIPEALIPLDGDGAPDLPSGSR
jgi:hypothetical protein